MKKLLSAFFVAILMFGSTAHAEETFTVAAETPAATSASSSTVTVTTDASATEGDIVVVNPGSKPDADTVTVIHGSKLFEGIGGLLYAALAGIAVWLYSMLSKIAIFNKLVSREQYQKLVDPLLDEAVAFGVGRLNKADWADVETKNEALGTAVNYVIDHGPELLKKFGIGREALLQKLEAKLVANGWDTKPGQWDNPSTETVIVKKV